MERLPPPPRASTGPDSGRVLVLAAHPGDELIGLGGTLALHARERDPVHVIVADAMQEFQVVEPVVLVVTVFMVDFCLLLHGEEQSAVPTASALMLEEFSSGCVGFGA